MATYDKGGFFGESAIGVMYEFTDQHSIATSIGKYSVENKKYNQFNLAFRYSRWRLDTEDVSWQQLPIGLFAIKSGDRKKYFIRSSSEYPDDDYYEETAIRLGLEISSTITFVKYKIEFSYHLRILDTGLIAIYNNKSDLEFYYASGLSFRYRF